MTYRAGLWTGVLGTIVLASIAMLGWKIVTEKPGDKIVAKATPPATVVKTVKEDALNLVTLTPEAEERLNVKVAAIERKAVPRSRVFGGEVIVPVGRAILVAAPLGGTIKAPAAGLVAPGRQVKKRDPILSLYPLLTPEARTTLATARVDAEGQVKNALTQRDATKIALDRAKRLLKEEAGSQRAVDESQALFDISLKTLEAAEARFQVLAKAVGDLDKGTAAPIVMESPVDGLLRNLNVSPEQFVPTGAPLFEVVDLDRVWVKVPVYVGDQSEIAGDDNATVSGLSSKPGEPTHVARPVLAPPSANPLAATVDLFYDVDNKAARWTPGQRVGITLPLRGDKESLVVPWSAVIHDIHGATWVFERTAPRTYVRRRVAVSSVAGDLAVLARGPQAGTVVVIQGAQELFGTETGFGH